MIELTTGVVFLMSSLYGSGQANAQMQAAAINAVPSAPQSTTAAASSFTSDITTTSDPAAMEAYLRTQFADTPILVDIARCESNFQQFDKDGDLVHGHVDSRDIGVMQINVYYQGDTAKKLGFDLTTVDGNVAYAKHLYEEQGTAPWNSSSKCWSQAGGIAKK